MMIQSIASIAVTASLSATPAEDIAAHCEARGGEAAACMCVAAQAENRFETEELEIVALAMDPNLTRQERSAALQSSGVSVQELSSITREMVAAEPAIQQACGAGLMRATPR